MSAEQGDAKAQLSHEEQVLWKLIQENGYFWKGKYVKGEYSWTLKQEFLNMTELRKHWPTFQAVAAGLASADTLPSMNTPNPNPAIV